MIAFRGLPGDWGLPDVAQGRQKAKDRNDWNMIAFWGLPVIGVCLMLPRADRKQKMGEYPLQFARCLMIGVLRAVTDWPPARRVFLNTHETTGI